MVTLDNYPSGLLEALDRKGVSEDKLMLLAKCDMNKEGAHCDCYLAATAGELIVISGIMTLSPREHRHFSGATAARLESGFTELSYECFMLDDLDDFQVEELLSSGRLTAESKEKDGRVLVAVFTNTSKAQMNLFCK